MPLSDFVPAKQGNVAVLAYVFSIVSFCVMVYADVEWWGVVLAEAVIFCALLLAKRIRTAQTAFVSYFLGLLFSLGALSIYYNYQFSCFGYYMMSLSFFHWSEFVTTAIFNANTLSIDSFLINHSREYGIAAVASWAEFWIEFYFLPSMKHFRFISWIGLMLVVSGEALRKLAMFTAGANFTHQVQYRKRASHMLVTTGVYSVFRHPSYVGWFYWSIGTQLLLCNPVCTVGYTVASWMFFDDRITDEEQLLLHFFGTEYAEYQKKVKIGIPFIKGFQIKS